jgi:hypothetical protein
MRYLAIAVVVACGCLPSEGLVTSQSCIGSHAHRQMSALQEIARISAEAPVQERIAELLEDTAQSAARIETWTELTKAHIGRAEAPPEVMTAAETGAQALYRQEIARRQALKESLPLKIPGGGGKGLSGLLGALAGGGPAALLTTALGVLLKRKSRQARALDDERRRAQAAAREALDVIADAPAEVKTAAGKLPNLLRVYKNRKASEYDSRIMELELDSQA